MTIAEIQELIRRDETRTLELKKTTGELKDAMRTACAFLNTDGGFIIFGIAPVSLKVLGQDVTDATRREIAQALSGIEPAIDIKPEYVDVPEANGKQLIVLHFDRWNLGDRPFTYDSRPYLRAESATRIMSRDIFESRLKAYKPMNFFWELQEAVGVELSDLDENRISDGIRAGVNGGRLNSSALNEPQINVLNKLKLIENGRPNNAAVVLVAKETHYYTQLKIRLARFAGTNKNEFIDNQQVSGNFFDILDAAIAFCFKHLNLSGKIEGLRREEKLEIPIVALREAIINSLAHRDYENRGTSTGLAIYDDRVEIENPGRLPHELSPETILQSHDSFPYNPVIAQALYKMTYLENWGSGIRRIADSCREAGVEEPTYTDGKGFVTVCFKRPSYKGTQTSDQTSDQTSGQTSDQTSGQTIMDTILNEIRKNPKISSKQLSKTLSKSPTTIKKYISILKETGKIVRIGPQTYGGQWEILE